jgi:hypothetical protein
VNTIENAPVLDLDKVLYFSRGLKPSPRTIRERRVVWNLFKHLLADGWHIASVYDGDDYVKVTDPKSALEIIFNLDDTTVSFVKAGAQRHGVKLVLGNDLDVISDWYFSAGDPDGFSATMDKFDAEVCA